MNGENDMYKSIRLNWAVLPFCIIGIILRLVFVSDCAKKLSVISTIALFFLALQQTFSARHSARAAQVSSQSAAHSQKQPTYIHLASLWYQITGQPEAAHACR